MPIPEEHAAASAGVGDGGPPEAAAVPAKGCARASSPAPSLAAPASAPPARAATGVAWSDCTDTEDDNADADVDADDDTCSAKCATRAAE
jgi:hypothetical protein